MVEIIELGELKTVEDATHDQCDENGIDGTSCGGKMISVPAIPNYYGRTKRHLMCQNHIHNYWGAIAWYEQENNLKRLHGKPVSHIRFYDGSTESFDAETIKTGVICGDNGCSGELLETEYGKASKVHCNKCDYSEIMEWDAESFEAQSETFASECECGEGVEGEEYECTCCDGIFCVDCIENGDISAYTIMTGDNPVADHPRIEETETGSNFSGWGAICGECMSAIEYELGELPPIHEVMEEDQGTANFSMEGQVKKKSNLTELALAGAIIGLLTFSAMKRK